MDGCLTTARGRWQERRRCELDGVRGDHLILYGMPMVVNAWSTRTIDTVECAKNAAIATAR
jgi:hypothetical protein